MVDALSFAWLSITRHRLRFLLAVTAIAVAVLVLAGCGHHTAQKSAATPAAPRAAVPLPEWAPKNPSPEFLRAARVLKPMPAEVKRLSAQGVPPETAKALAAKRMMLVWPAAYELFGALNDEQTAQFLQVREMVAPSGKSGMPPIRVRGYEVVVPAKQLTTKQRTALDRYLEAARKSDDFDLLVFMYKRGARRDLSNVRVGFTTAQAGGGHIVSVVFYITTLDGIRARLVNNPFAEM